MLRNIVAGMIIATICASVSFGATFDYTSSGMDMTNGDWGLETYGSYFNAVYSSTLSESNLNFTHVHANGNNGRFGAYVWEAAAGEVITSINFDYSSYGMYSVIFTSDNMTDSFENFTREWYGGGTHGGQALTFTEADGIKRIGLGFDGRLGTTYNGYYSQFAQVQVETVPEPGTMMLVGVGSLMLGLRRRSKKRG